MPPELKALKNKAEQKKNHLEAALDSLKASLPQANSEKEAVKSKKETKPKYDETTASTVQNFNFSISLTTKMEDEKSVEGEESEEEQEDTNKPSVVQTVSKTTIEESDLGQTQYQKKKEETQKLQIREAFFNLLKEKKIDPGMKWNNVDSILRHEKRYNAISKISERKKMFADYIQLSKKAERNVARSKLEKSRTDFIEMLKDFENLTSDSKWSYCVQYFYMDPRYQSVEEKERENLFQDYLDELWEKEKRNGRDEREEMIERMKEHFKEITLIKVTTTWDQACDLLKYNPVWLKMNELDRLEAFSDYILNMEKEQEDERRKTERRQERINRLQYREFLQECVAEDRLTFKTKWRNFVKQYCEEPRMYNLFRQYGTTPFEIFEDVREELREKQKQIKEDFKAILKTDTSKFQEELTVDEFVRVLSGYEKFKNHTGENCNSLHFCASYLLDKLNNRIGKAKDKLTTIYIEQIVRDHNQTLEEVQENIRKDEHDASYLSCLSSSYQKDRFLELQQKAVGGEDITQLIPHSKKKPKKKKEEKPGKYSNSRESKHGKGERSKSRHKKNKDGKLNKRSKLEEVSSDVKELQVIQEKMELETVLPQVEVDISTNNIDKVEEIIDSSKKLKVEQVDQNKVEKQIDVSKIAEVKPTGLKLSERLERDKAMRRRKKRRDRSFSNSSSSSSSDASRNRRRKR